MTARPIDPRTEDTISYELVRTDRSSGTEQQAGRATFSNGRTRVEADDDLRVAVEELLGRAFVDRVEADERPRGYRRSGRGIVDMLVPGMPEHFIARMRGLWLSYPDGTVVTARPAPADSHRGPAQSTAIEPVESGPPVTDASVRRATLADSDEILNVRPLLRPNPPLVGLRGDEERTGTPRTTDCGWLV
ncbi:MAG TPA: hypothetical protein VHK28_01795 [Candidatus Limnocylindria bacterium]|nr:hypothetical protein [Candidatus Limnocylindria bacterium]